MSIRNQVLDLITQQFGRGEELVIDDEQSLLERGVLDSLTLMELVELLSQRFGVVVSEEELTPENLDSIGGLTRFLESKGVSV
jgi:acyl carrier protein